LAFRISEKSLSIRSNARPVTFGSMPAPLISLPICPTTRTSSSRKGSRGRWAFRQGVQGAFPLQDARGRHPGDGERPVESVLHDGQAETEIGGGGDRLPHRLAQSEEAVLQGIGMVGNRAAVLAQPDAEHLQDPALGRADEFGVGFDAVDGDRVAPIGEGIAAEVHGTSPNTVPICSTAIEETTGAPQDASVNVQSLQDRRLALGRGAAVAAHGR